MAEQFTTKYNKTLLTLDELAEVLSITKATILQYISRETFDIPLIKIGRNWFVSALTLADYLVRKEATCAL